MSQHSGFPLTLVNAVEAALWKEKEKDFTEVQIDEGMDIG